MPGPWTKYLIEEGGTPIPRTVEGYPIRNGHNPMLRQEELEDLPCSFDARCRIFDLSNGQDLEDYTAVLDRIANGQFIRLMADREMEDKEKKTWLILCRWAEVKGEIPPELLAQLGA